MCAVCVFIFSKALKPRLESNLFVQKYNIKQTCTFHTCVDSSTQPRPRHTSGIQLPGFAVLRSQVAGMKGKCFLCTSLRSIVVIRHIVCNGKVLIIIKVEKKLLPLRPKKLIPLHAFFFHRFIEFNLNRGNTAASILMSPYYLGTGTSLKYALMNPAS